MPTLADAWARLLRSRSATLGTVGPDGSPHLVPCCFALDGVTLYSAVDDKPKTSARLQRLANVAADPRVTVLVDRYDERWDQLWWVRASGLARLVDNGDEHTGALRLLLAKYRQYDRHALTGPILAVTLRSWRSWTAT